MPKAVAGFLLVWLALITALGAGRAFATPRGQPPLALIAGVWAPVVLFFATYWLSGPFREYVLAADLRLISGIQAWRFLGFGFIALYASGVLPGVFAWPAGLGDMAIATAAPWTVLGLVRRADFVRSGRFRLWNWLGILDLVIAVSAGAIGSGLVPGVVGTVTTAPMAQLPLVYVPVYLVPIMIMLHATALLQARRATAVPGRCCRKC